MSENFIQDQFVKKQLTEMEKARQILAGHPLRRRFHPLSVVLILIMVASFIILNAVGIEMSLETELILIVAVFLVNYERELRTMNKRLDNLVELTRAEKKLKEKYQSAIQDFTHSESE